MAGDGAGNGSDACRTPEEELPPCCRKARAPAPESEAKCHETVVSGWFSDSSLSAFYLSPSSSASRIIMLL
ncbi:hypothetical protein OPV22_019181 [Ensete ventricosum]|uniref:Uncharacterized protein n=1 Tax=Ensete ventricosum TaxID=4639 RepID=A0AAV8PK36_ENSVE|nr:hypothetical protein OPV22_019181 [Ensete ventricosum]